MHSTNKNNLLKNDVNKMEDLNDDNILDVVDNWRKSESNLKLWEFLGLSFLEYREFVTGTKTINQIMELRKTN